MADGPKAGAEKGSRDSLKPGSVLQQRYKIVAAGYQGRNFGAFPAEDSKTGGRVTLKVLQCEADEAEKALKQFRAEYESLKSLKHPALPQLFDLFEERGNYFMVLNRIEAKSLAEMIDEKKKPTEVTLLVRWLYELLDVLDYLHAQEPPIIHRDLQPANIMIAPDTHLRLLDFGIAKIVDRPELRTVYGKAGNPVYAPIEQFSLKRSDPRMDIFSAGAAFYHALSGQAPPPASERVLKMVPLASLHTLNPAVPEALTELIHAMMAIKPQERPLNAKAVRARLVEIQPSLEAGSEAPKVEPPPTPAPVAAPEPAPAAAPPQPAPAPPVPAPVAAPTPVPAAPRGRSRPRPAPVPTAAPPSPAPARPAAKPSSFAARASSAFTAVPVSFVVGGPVVTPHFGNRVAMARIAAVIFITCTLAGFVSLHHLQAATNYPTDVRNQILNGDFLAAWRAAATDDRGASAARTALLTMFGLMAVSGISLLTTFFLLITALMGREEQSGLMFNEFKTFLLRGNVVDLAVGVVMGAAFGGVVTALVKDLITPLIAAVAGKPDFSAITFSINGSNFPIGDFINSLVSFLLIGTAVFFLVIKPINFLVARARKDPAPADPTTKKCSECLSEIAIQAKRCAFCTSPQTPEPAPV